jgi:DNA invertase Pin-like site-specific DNA recombinase
MANSRKHRSGNPKVATAYMRASTDDQTLSPEAQRASIQTWAMKEGIQVVEWHCDLGVSGSTELDQRPGLLAALGALRVHKAGLLVITRRDRLARDPAIAALIERAVVQQGARIVSADGLGNSGSAADSFLKTILDGAAAYERALIRARTKEALKTKRAQGYRAGTVPFGYTADESGKLFLNPQEQALMVRIKELRVAGYSLRKVVEALAKESSFSRAGKFLSLTQVARIAKTIGPSQERGQRSDLGTPAR